LLDAVLNEALRGKFDRVAQELIQVMDNVSLRRYLFQKNVITANDYERILSQSAVNSQSCQILFNAVSKSIYKRSYILLRDALLREPEIYGHILEKLESIDLSR